MAIEIVDLPIENGDFPYLCGCLPEGSFCFRCTTVTTVSVVVLQLMVEVLMIFDRP